MPKVSVLVPVYNVEKYLRKCLDSLVNQTLEDIEIICINDGSTDSSPQILTEYAARDSRIKIINKKNTGYGHSMNTGMDIANGEFIGILESDDFADNRMFEDLYNLAQTHNADVVKSDWYNYWGEDSRSIKAGMLDKTMCGETFTADEYCKVLNIMPSIWSGIYKREFLILNKIRFTETTGASYQDTAFNFKVMLCAQRILLTDRAYVYYRQDNPNSSVKSKSKAFAICIEYDEVERFMKERGLTNNLEYVYSIMFKSYAHNLLRLDKSLVRSFIERYSEKFKNLYNRDELGDLFFSRCDKKELLTLINDRMGYFKLYKKKYMRNIRNIARRELISINCSTQKLSIKILGKEIVRLG